MRFDRCSAPSSRVCLSQKNSDGSQYATARIPRPPGCGRLQFVGAFAGWRFGKWFGPLNQQRNWLFVWGFSRLWRLAPKRL